MCHEIIIKNNVIEWPVNANFYTASPLLEYPQ